ncbi:MAG TPA: acyl carrier protein [Streptosporangiaceae bacterium]
MWDEKFEVLLRAYLPFLSDEEELRPELDLRDYGLDSLGVVDLLGTLESEYCIRLTEDVLSMETFAEPGVLWQTLNEIRQANPDWMASESKS